MVQNFFFFFPVPLDLPRYLLVNSTGPLLFLLRVFPYTGYTGYTLDSAVTVIPIGPYDPDHLVHARLESDIGGV